jgi:hypothetical protein
VLGFWFPLLVLVLLLEGLRLSLDVTAVELLPVAYVFFEGGFGVSRQIWRAVCLGCSEMGSLGY